MAKSFSFNPFTGNFDLISTVSIGSPVNGLSITSNQVLTIGLSSTSTTGALSNTDWNTFNGKQAAGNYITALTGDVTASGPGSAAATLATVNSNVGSFNYATITVNAKGLITAASSGSAPTGTVTSVSVVSANGLAGTVATATTTPALTLSTTITGILQGDGTAISAATVGNLTDAGTDGITITGGTGAIIGSGAAISQHVADSTHNGYLSSADWSTFNGKQAAGNYITALTGDVTASGPGSSAATLATVNSNVGSFTYSSITVNAKGLITAASSGAAPTGTVTSVSVVTANGVSGSVATATTTPAITLTLGAITPSSVAAVGTVTGSNLSGTNTGDQTITLTGDVTGSGTGSFATTIANNAVTNAKIANSTIDLTTKVTGVLPSANVGLGRTINAQTGTTYTFVLSDGSAAGGNPLVTASNGSAQTYTVPPNSSVAFPVGTQIDVLQLGSGKVTLAQGAGVTINSKSSNKAISAQYVGVSLIKMATDTWTLLGDLIA